MFNKQLGAQHGNIFMGSDSQEKHPLKPFFPKGARLLMLGSFPPQRNKWSMEFFYPNFQNDMWRIFGIIYFSDPLHFTIAGKKSFDKNKLETFLSARKIALYDVAISVVRLKDNASDAFLEIKETLNLPTALKKLPECSAVAATGKKACQTLAETLNVPEPKIGECARVEIAGRKINFYRMASTSRAYPLPIAQKALIYASMMRKENLL